MLDQRNYEVSIIIGLNYSCMLCVIRALYTCTSLKLPCDDMFEHYWMTSMAITEKLRLES